MMESKRIAKLYSDWFKNNPWSFVKLEDILKNITVDQAAKNIIPNANSIWKLVQHCLGWRENVLLKMKGAEFKSPEDNYLNEPETKTEFAWEELKKRFIENENQWQIFLMGVTDSFLNEGYKPSKNEFTNYEVIHGLLHHDHYHFGQISMLKKMIENQ